jgi:hypothetical protein
MLERTLRVSDSGTSSTCERERVTREVMMFVVVVVGV